MSHAVGGALPLRSIDTFITSDPSKLAENEFSDNARRIVQNTLGCLAKVPVPGGIDREPKYALSLTTLCVHGNIEWRALTKMGAPVIEKSPVPLVEYLYNVAMNEITVRPNVYLATAVAELGGLMPARLPEATIPKSISEPIADGRRFAEQVLPKLSLQTLEAVANALTHFLGVEENGTPKYWISRHVRLISGHVRLITGEQSCWAIMRNDGTIVYNGATNTTEYVFKIIQDELHIIAQTAKKQNLKAAQDALEALNSSSPQSSMASSSSKDSRRGRMSVDSPPPTKGRQTSQSKMDVAESPLLPADTPAMGGLGARIAGFLTSKPATPPAPSKRNSTSGLPPVPAMPAEGYSAAAMPPPPLELVRATSSPQPDVAPPAQAPNSKRGLGFGLFGLISS